MQDFSGLVLQFSAEYDAASMDQKWQALSKQVRQFWSGRILSTDPHPISDIECDEVIRILDRNGKGNTKSTESVARAMIPQGAWRRLFNEFHSNQPLGKIVHSIMVEEDTTKKAELIDRLYEVNTGQNYLTGKSGNAIGALLAAYDPINNLSIISLGDRRAIVEYFGLPVTFAWDMASIGTQIIATTKAIMELAKQLGLQGSARTIARFFYYEPVKEIWKNQGHTVKTIAGEVSVTVPTESDEEESLSVNADVVRESMQIQGLLAKIGAKMGFKIWLPKADRSRVLKVWTPQPGELVDDLPIGYDSTTTATIVQIDVLWLRKRSIVRAFEVEHTTSIYSGLLRMADLVALQPNINIKLHIVAPAERRKKVLDEIGRPVFTLWEGPALSQMCSYLSFDQIHELSELPHLSHMSHEVLENYAEYTSDGD